MVVCLYHCKMTYFHQINMQTEHSRALTLKLSPAAQDVLSYIKGNISHSEIMSCTVQSLALLLHSLGGEGEIIKVALQESNNTTLLYFSSSLTLPQEKELNVL